LHPTNIPSIVYFSVASRLLLSLHWAQTPRLAVRGYLLGLRFLLTPRPPLRFAAFFPALPPLVNPSRVRLLLMFGSRVLRLQIFYI